jgi:hypothetical protein
MEQLLAKLMEAGIGVEVVEEQVKLSIPKGLDATVLVNEIRQHKAELISYINQAQRGNQATRPVRISASDGHCELFYHQKKEYLRFLVLGAHAFNMNMLIPFRNLNKAALLQTLQTLLERHEGLRTNYMRKDGRFYQCIHDAHPVNGIVEHIDISQLADQGDIGQQLLADSMTYEFDFENELLLIFTLVTIQEDTHVLSFTLHHAISDDTSIKILKREIETLYAAFEAGKPNPLPPVTWQFKDYAAWINNWMSSEKGQTAKTFYHQKLRKSIEQEYGNTFFTDSRVSYRRELAAELEALTGTSEIPGLEELYGSVVRLQPQPGARYNAYLDQTALTALQQKAAAYSTSTNRLITAAFALMVARLRGTRSVRMYTPCSTRVFDVFEEIVGWLTSEVIATIEIREADTLEALFMQIEQDFLNTSTHCFYPHESLLHELDVPLTILTPYFLNFIPPVGNPIQNTKAMHNSNGSGHFGFKCEVLEYTDGMELAVNYNTGIYTPAEAEAMINDVLALLYRICTEPSLTVKQLLMQS